MSPAVGDFSSQSSSAQRAYFQNPNPNVQKYPTDSGIFNSSFNHMIFSDLDFDCSKDAAAAAVRPSRRKPVKVKKPSSRCGSVSSKNVNSTGKTIAFVFNGSDSVSVSDSNLGKTVSGGDGEQQSVRESLDLNMLHFTMGSTNNNKSEKNMGSEEAQNSGNHYQFGSDSKFDSSAVETAGTRRVSERGAQKFGKLNGLDFVFGANTNNGVMKSKSEDFVHEYGPDDVGTHVDQTESNGTKGTSGIDGFMKANNFTTEAESILVSSMSGLNVGTGEPSDVAPLMKNDNPVTIEDNKISDCTNSGDGVNKNVYSGSVFWGSEVNGLFHIGNQDKKTSSCKGRRKRNKQKNNLKSEGAESCGYLKKQDNNVGSVFDGNNSFVFGSYLGNAFSDTPQSKVSDELKTSNIHGPTKKNTLNSDSCSYFDDSFVFGSENRNLSSARSEAMPLNQCTAAKKSDKFNKQNQPINQIEKNSDEFETYKFGVFKTSFTGFNTPDINLASSFTSDMFPGLGLKLEFSKSNSVRLRKLKKSKAKLRPQGRNRQQGGCNLSKEVLQSVEESSGCSPMDFSPYGSTEGVSTSTDPAISKVKNEDDVGSIENLSANNFSASSAPSFADADVSTRQQPHQKKYVIKSGQGSKITTRKVSRAHEFTSSKHTGVSDQEICDNWRKRGNQAYKKGDMSEAEGCYSKGIRSIQHIVTPGVCIEPLLLCYSNRAAARMALGRLREGLMDCRIAARLDPTFVKANLRSANCYLLLGELEDASYNYNKCLDSENIVCLDRRLAIEAADGLQKVQKVDNDLKKSAELLQQKTYESATTALGIITDVLSVSCYSEKLLSMKGEALLVLGKHKDVVQLCEQTLQLAEKNFATESKLWRWSLMSKSYFYLGRLEIALDVIEKHEQLRPTVDKSVESLIPLAVTISELLHCKNAGNEAFQNGKHSEAIEHYSAAISKSMESHSFAAVCFCNRAAAHQSLGEIIDAIGDCSIAIALDGTYPKALSRRSTLWEMVRDYKHAADDLQRLIPILETRSGENSQKSNGSVKDLRRASRRLSFIEENSKKERSLDLYLILGIKPSDTAAEVKKAYRKAALRHHPDKAGQVIARAESGSDGQKWKVITESVQMDADKLFKMIGEAYAVLSDTTKRSKYDLEEEMWDDMNTRASSSDRKSSDFYNSPFETTNRRNSQYSHYWGNSRKNFHNSYPRW